ncbi:phage terminase small subunit P27 family [Methylobacterium sp. J-068]|uniref:phage terminase small subunit P27 family n=1 Tax=Methylobacterium sp. J-068 TaxID=2836649 RepID=UPI001FBBF22C|nr:phage terminase small subunit P27 family [Methylobacterium sp. J-068]MCJ2033157.1 phage terminase small subunit P27 family [Methylobacterium sp. J-068]
MRGRKPDLQAIEGGLASVPRAPAWLPTEAKEEWKRVLPSLIKRRILTAADMGTVENYCLAAGTIRRCQVTIATEGDTVETKEGSKRHPAFQTLGQMMTEHRRLAAELGLTPTSRNKAGKPPDGEDGYDAYADLGI